MRFPKAGWVLGLLLLAPSLAAAQEPASPEQVAAGQKVFVQCRACHQVGPSARNLVGPVLNGLFGRHSGSVEGYNYSAANLGSGIVWTEAEFRDYIHDPKAKIPGTKMIFAGIKDDRKIGDLIAYLHSFDHAPVTLVTR